mmetsp:Transcript_16704/g.28431  ORF Transcript_16704/g.28431 Transcript_16704/m.28431 type:complete len:120 (-) Transcript_16704:151-510(-)
MFRFFWPFILMWWANASPLVALQKGFTMNADVPTKSDSCQAESQQKFRAAIDLRTKHLPAHEQRLANLHLQLTGEEWVRHSSETGFDGIETALTSRQTEIERLLKATEAAIARKKAQVQ